jgi:hypothetical protein
MTRAVVNCASDSWVTGQTRLRKALIEFGGGAELRFWTNQLPAKCPPHRAIGCFGGSGPKVPYAFKAYALREAANRGGELLLWCDASILPIRSLEPLWERIERDGYWFSPNGYSNYEWTADSAYPDLFAFEYAHQWPPANVRAANRLIPHVVATAFGLNVRHPLGRAFLGEYYRLASETQAFCGPHWNTAYEGGYPENDRRVGLCGPLDVRGHRHDQTAASVIAWRLGMELAKPPVLFSYRGGETSDIILVADGSY